MLRADSELAEFFCFYPSLVTFWDTLVANDAKNSPFWAQGHDVFWGP